MSEARDTVTTVAPGLTSEVLDRAAGARVGSAMGDALGAPYEFGPGTLEPEMVGGGGFGWGPGEWTDDTLRTPTGPRAPVTEFVPRVRRRDVLGGLIHEYERVAA